MKTHTHTYDLPDHITFNTSVAIDTEAMGLKNYRDRLCLVQLSQGDGECHLIHFPEPYFHASHNLKKLLTNSSVQKIFHYARFDVAILMHTFQLNLQNIYCTKIASKLSRTYCHRHGLKDLCKELLNIDLSKQEQTSDWGAEILSPDQIKYAATDVLHLHKLKEKLDSLLERENRREIAQACFDFLPYRAQMDLWGGEAYDVLSYSSQ